MRSFVAVPLPEAIQASIFAAAQELARALPDVKWSRKVENLHITVKFLGPVGGGAAGRDRRGAGRGARRRCRGSRSSCAGWARSRRRARRTWSGRGSRTHARAGRGGGRGRGVGERSGVAREQRAFTGPRHGGPKQGTRRRCAARAGRVRAERDVRRDDRRRSSRLREPPGRRGFDVRLAVTGRAGFQLKRRSTTWRRPRPRRARVKQEKADKADDKEATAGDPRARSRAREGDRRRGLDDREAVRQGEHHAPRRGDGARPR